MASGKYNWGLELDISKSVKSILHLVNSIIKLFKLFVSEIINGINCIHNSVYHVCIELITVSHEFVFCIFKIIHEFISWSFNVLTCAFKCIHEIISLAFNVRSDVLNLAFNVRSNTFKLRSNVINCVSYPFSNVSENALSTSLG